MPTRLTSNFPRLSDPDEFESLIRDICALDWGDPNTAKFGRKGQKQFGVDVYGRPGQHHNIYRGAQCKLRTQGDQLSEREINKEVADALQFPHQLDALIIVTDTPRDTSTQVIVDKINELQISEGNFRVTIWFWDDITERLAAYPRLIARYYKDFLKNISSFSSIENLVDFPLQIYFDGTENSNHQSTLKDAIRFRGIRIQDPRKFEMNFLDGIFCYLRDVRQKDRFKTLLQFASTVKGYIDMKNDQCLLFVYLGSSTTAFIKIAKDMSLDIEQITIFDQHQEINEIADRIFVEVFSNGYSRRGGLSTIDITARTKPAKPISSLLDVDFQSKLSVNKFPSKEEWETLFVPALEILHSEILKQGDNIRVQFNSQLPLPAAIALGFYFNLRTARVGVWTRKTGMSDFRYQFWLSDSAPADIKFPTEWVKQSSGNGQAAVMELSTYSTIHDAVHDFIQILGIDISSWVKMQLVIDGETLENIEEAQAIAYANQVGQLARELISYIK
jgi:hypothetical protein